MTLKVSEVTGIITGRDFTLIGGNVNFICVGGREGGCHKEAESFRCQGLYKRIGT